MKKMTLMATIILGATFMTGQVHAQGWSLGGDIGLSMLYRSSGFHMTPAAEFNFDRQMSVGSELSINTQYGAPIIWHPYFRYYFAGRSAKLQPYANAGPVLAMNVPNGPCFGLLFGGGLTVPVAGRISIGPNILFGPLFEVGGGDYPFILEGYYWGIHTFGLSSYSISGATVFVFTMRLGLRYDL